MTRGNEISVANEIIYAALMIAATIADLKMPGASWCFCGMAAGVLCAAFHRPTSEADCRLICRRFFYIGTLFSMINSAMFFRHLAKGADIGGSRLLIIKTGIFAAYTIYVSFIVLASCLLLLFILRMKKTFKSDE